ncbi:unnamed protein product [Darwinula stevensoni]|uniref:Kringle domain-containing protein n=1 Tax=Darwinula stevensoni TaxID=69355 RepID=A0A7R9AEV4_9CRUS|nr:unnamed protein product [Darwinula stevensoni]CAG0902684.1 unnamed protein product [Darwinula stevensoni]
MEPRGSPEDIIRIILAYLLLSRGVASVELIPYLGVHKGQRYENVTSESQELSLGTCTINCVMHEPIPCYAFNYRETDRSCQLILNRMSRLVDANGYWSYVQWLCLREYPTIENAKVSFEGWNGTYRAPARGIVKFRCEHPRGFSDGALLHTAECAPLNPDSWCISFREDAVKYHADVHHNFCRNPHMMKMDTPYYMSVNIAHWCYYKYGDGIRGGYCDIPFSNRLFEDVGDRTGVYPECLLTMKGKEYVGSQNKTETGKTSPLECKKDMMGESYIGTKNVTNKGHKCQPCIAGRMEKEQDMYSDYDGNELQSVKNLHLRILDDLHPTHNFCRNWNGDEGGPWCYKSGVIGRDYCDIPICSQNVPEK